MTERGASPGARKEGGSADSPGAPKPTGPSLLQRVLITLGALALAIVVGLGIYFGLGSAGYFDLNYGTNLFLRLLPNGFVSTLGLMAVVIPLGFTVGFLVGWGRTSRAWLPRSVATVYVEFFRGMPPIVLVVFAFLIVVVIVAKTPFLDARIQDSFSFAISMSVIALALHSASYQAEIIRAGILSVPAGQHEAAQSIGMSKGATMLHVVLPQMFRVSLPALGNEFASVIKDTSILSVVGIIELTLQGRNTASRLASQGQIDNLIITWIEVAILYFILTFVVSYLLQLIEKHFRVPGLEAAQL